MGKPKQMKILGVAEEGKVVTFKTLKPKTLADKLNALAVSLIIFGVGALIGFIVGLLVN